MKSRILLEPPYRPGELEQRIEAFVADYNSTRAREGLQNLKPADVYSRAATPCWQNANASAA